MSEKKEFCKCVSEMEEKVLSFYKEQGKLINPNKVEFVNTSFLLSGNSGPGIQPFLPVQVYSETKTGKEKKTKVNIYFSYCPMCGQKWKEDKENQDD